MTFWSNKRWKTLLAALLVPLVLLPCATRADGLEEVETPQPLVCTFILHEANDGQEMHLGDRDVATCMRVRSDRTIDMLLPAMAEQLYIAWHEPPVNPVMTFTDASGEVLSGVDMDADLLYQSLAVPSGAKHAVLSASADFAVSEFAAYKELPDTLLLPTPTSTKTDLLLVVAHTGDESYYFGGLIPILAGEKEHDVTVMFLSHQSRVAQEEAMLSLRECGVTAQPIFAGFSYRLRPYGTNAAFRTWDGSAVKNRIALSIRACAPEVVVTHDPAGEDGDAMHAYAAALTEEAVKIAANAELLAVQTGAADVWQAACLYEHGTGGVELPVDTQLPKLDGMTARELAQSGFDRYSSLKLYHKAALAADMPQYALRTEYRTAEPDPLTDLSIGPMPTPEPEATPTPAPTPEETPLPQKTRTKHASFTEFCGWTRRHAVQIMGLSGIVAALWVLGIALFNRFHAFPLVLYCLIPLVLGAAAVFALPAVNDVRLAAIEAAATPTPSPAPTPTPTPVLTAEPTPTPDPDAGHFRQEGEPAEVVTFDNESGTYSYRSDTLSVEIQRFDIRNNNNQPVRYFVTHLRMRDENPFRPGYGTYRENGRDPADPFVMARRYKAVVAITGDNMIHSDEKNKALIVRSGRLYLDNRGGSTMVFTPDGMRMYIQPGNTIYAQDLLDMGVENSFSFGPMLIQDGVINERANEHYLSGYNPRVGVGFVEDGHFVLIVVEGRVGKYSRGVRMSEFAQMFCDEGCTQAYNLDGGASSCLLFMGEYLNRRMANQYRDIPDLLMWGYSELVPGPDDAQMNAAFYNG